MTAGDDVTHGDRASMAVQQWSDHSLSSRVHDHHEGTTISFVGHK